MNKRCLLFIFIFFECFANNEVACDSYCKTKATEYESVNPEEDEECSLETPSDTTKSSKNKKSKKELSVSAGIGIAAAGFLTVATLATAYALMPPKQPVYLPSPPYHRPLFTVTKNEYIKALAINLDHEYTCQAAALIGRDKIFIACSDGKIRFYDIIAQRALPDLTIDTGMQITQATLSNSGKKIAVGGTDSSFAIINLEYYDKNPRLQNIEKLTIQVADGQPRNITPTRLSFSHDDRFIAISGIEIIRGAYVVMSGSYKYTRTNRIFIFNCETKTFLEIPFACHCLRFNPQDSTMAACINLDPFIFNDEYKICLINLSNPGKPEVLNNRTFDIEETTSVIDFTFSPDGDHIIAYGLYDKQQSVIDYDLKNQIGTIHTHPIYSISALRQNESFYNIECSPDGANFLTASLETLTQYSPTRIMIFNSKNFKFLHLINFNNDKPSIVKPASFNNDGSKIVVVLKHHVIVLTDLFPTAKKSMLGFLLAQKWLIVKKQAADEQVTEEQALKQLKEQNQYIFDSYINRDIFEYSYPRWNTLNDDHEGDGTKAKLPQIEFDVDLPE